MSSSVSRAAGLACLIALVAGLAQAAEPKPTRILAKAGGSFEERAQDHARCRAIATAAPLDDLPQTGSHAIGGGYAEDLPTAAGVAIAFALIALIDIGNARNKAAAFCMANLGYVGAPLTPEEAHAYNALVGPRREAWERTFLAQDLTARIEPLRTPTVPQLPPYRPEPATQGGVKVDLASLAAKPGEVEAGGVVATGGLSRWRTAELTAPFATHAGLILLSAKAGAVFHQVDYRPQRAALLRDQGATWCGPVEEAAPGGTSTQLYCFTSHEDGYDVFRPTGFNWLAGPYRDGIVLPRCQEPIVLRERDQDDAAPMALEIKASEVSASGLRLEAFAKQSDRSVLLWRRWLKFDEAGKATLPLWSRRALVTHTGAHSVALEIDDQGDGHGWRDGDD